MNRGKIFTMVARVAVTLILVCGAALADEWMAPTTKQYQSPNKRYYFEVVPGKRGAAGAESSPYGTLSKAGVGGDRKELWSTRLVNEVAPVTAAVSNTGDYVATFDNWYQKGYGKGVVAIYGPRGRLIKSYELGDIFTKEDVEAFPHSVSSIHWGGEHYIDEARKMLVLKVVSNGKMQYVGSDVKYREVRIDLVTGNLVK